MRRLLILACSSTKREGERYMAARDRYDGPLWQTLRAADPEGRHAEHAFLSARYGFGCARQGIEAYNTQLTRETARRMIEGGLDTHWPEWKDRRRTPLGYTPGQSIASMWRYFGVEEPFAQVCLVGGHLYIEVMRAFVDAFQAGGYVAPDAKVTTINTAIGVMRQQMRAWLLEGETLQPPPRRIPTPEEADRAYERVKAMILRQNPVKGAPDPDQLDLFG